MGFIFGTISYLIRLNIKLALFSAVFVAVIVLIPNLPPYTKFTSIQIDPTQPRIGPLAPNGDLNNIEKLYKGKLLGPEAFQLHDGEVYTTLATGEIVKVSPGGHVTFVTKIGQPCAGLSQEHVCGRPLGFEIDEKYKQLYVADAYYGIWKVDLKTDKKTLLVSPRVEISGHKPKLFNGIALHKNGDFFWTDSTSDFLLRDGFYCLITDPSGRLFHYNAAKNESKVLLDDLWMANGVAVSPDGQFVVVAESGRLRLMKYYIAGPQKGKSEVFVTGLPGVPDNLRALPDGSGVLVALYKVFNDEYPLLSKSLAATPMLRKFLTRIVRLIEMPFEFLNANYPNPVFEDIEYRIGHFSSSKLFSPPLSGLAIVDWNGNVVASYYNTDGSLGGISEAVVVKDKLYLGSPHDQDFIGAVPAPPLLKKAFSSTKTTPPPKTAEPVTTEIPKSEKPQTKPVDTPKKKVQEKPKVEEKKAEPKVAKPNVQEPPKPAQQAKSAEKVKTAVPKVAEPKPTPKTAPTTTTPKSTTAKPAPKPATPSKQAETKAPAPKSESNPKIEKPTVAKPTKTTPQEPKTKKVSETKDKAQKSVPDQIPIKEEIPSDTAKPSKETLKVIKKGGPAEIPNPHL